MYVPTVHPGRIEVFDNPLYTVAVVTEPYNETTTTTIRRMSVFFLYWCLCVRPIDSKRRVKIIT